MRSPLLFRAALFVPAALFVLMAPAASPILAEENRYLADGGTSGYTIVLPDAPSAVQKSAAEELASFLNRVTGAEFPVLSQGQVEERARDNKKLLVIGPSKLSANLLASAGAEPEETIGQDGIILQTVGDTLVFSGHHDRGPLYAVYTFLEDAVGIRWWTSTESTIPTKPILEVPELSLRYAPKVISRESFYRDPRAGREGGIFSARLKMNGHFNLVPPEYGDHMPILFWAHSFDKLLPPDKYFEEHPEWYSLVDGKRTGKAHHQLCLSNPEMRAEFIHNTLTALRKAPDTRFISISQNDCLGWCQCEHCQKLVDENGSQAGPLLVFVNEVAEAIEKEFPHVLVETLAYHESRIAPSKVRPRDNVVIRLCSSACSFLTPMTEGEPRNQQFLECLDQWSAISKNLYIWDYVTNFHNYLLPHPNIQVFAPNIRYFVDHHAVGIFEQGDDGCPAGDFVRLRNWVLSKLLWNPDLDQSALEEEFLTGYYSPRVGALLRQYLNVLKQSALDARVCLSCSRDTARDWLSPEALVEATRLMDQAIAAAEEDERQDPVRFAGLSKKVRRESIPIRLMWVSLWQEYSVELAIRQIPIPISGTMVDYFQEFKTLLEENQVRCYREYGPGKGFDQWLGDMGDFINAPTAAPPEQVKDLPVGTWFDAQEVSFRLSSRDKWVFLEDDPNASNKRTARMPRNHTQWAVAWESDFAARLVSPGGEAPDGEGRVNARVFLYARGDAPEEDGAEDGDPEVMSVGVYDKKNTKSLFSRALKASELSGSDYKPIELGTFPLGEGVYVWAAPRKRAVPNAVSNDASHDASRIDDNVSVYVDRVVVIRQ